MTTELEPRLSGVESRLDRMERLQEQIQSQLGELTEKQSTTQQQVDKLVAESEKWDERFFQLSRDTLNFSRNIVVTAAVVAVLVPVLREAAATLIELFRPAG